MLGPARFRPDVSDVHAGHDTFDDLILLQYPEDFVVAWSHRYRIDDPPSPKLHPVLSRRPVAT
jgi:hypothetical protein